MHLPLLLTLSATIATLVSARFSSEVIFEVGSTTYWAPQDQQIDFGLVNGTESPLRRTLLSVITVDGEPSVESLKQAVEKYKKDDVWTEDFLETVLLQSSASSSSPSTLSTNTLSYLTSLNIRHLAVPSTWTVPSSVASKVLQYDVWTGQMFTGPGTISFYNTYFNIRPALALARDSHGAFISSAYSKDGKSFKPVPVSTHSSAEGLSVAYPSRLQSLSSDKPLAGLRFAVKDLYNVTGLLTGGGDRAFQSLYGDAKSTASSIQKLIDAGAILVGKTKTSQFAFKADPTADWVDVHAPYNPRGDGYNSATSSSAGSGAASAAYDFLDFTIGSDTGGSVRSPAAACGVYGIRPSFGALPLDGVLPQDGTMDTAGLFARSPSIFSSVSRVWYSEQPSLPAGPWDALPSTLTVLSDYAADEKATMVIEEWLEIVSKGLGMERKTVNVSETWDKFAGVKAGIAEYTVNIFGTLTGWYSWMNVGAKFFADYEAKHDGLTPFVDPQVRTGWDYGINQTQTGYNEMLSRKETFKSFWNTHINPHDNVTCSSTLLAFPYMGVSLPAPRNVYTAGPTPLNFYLQTFLAPYAGTPEIVIPIGQVERPSTISNSTQFLPVTIDIQAAPGCDYVLFDFIDKLTELGLVQEVKTGSSTF